MEPSSAGVLLAETHAVHQVKNAAVTQEALGRLFDGIVTPARIDESFEKYLQLALVLIINNREQGHETATSYYTAAKVIAGAPGGVPTMAAPALDLAAATVALTVRGSVALKQGLADGGNIGQAMTGAKAAQLGTAKRLMLDSPRETVTGMSKLDPSAQGWSRVSDGNPCYFCAMLVSRGPVYSEESGDFDAHDKCGCGARVFFDGSDGWSPQAEQLNKLWKAEDGDPALFRSAYNFASGRTQSRRLTKDTVKSNKSTKRAERRAKKIMKEPTPDERRSQVTAQLSALEKSLADLQARAANSDVSLSKPITWQKERIAKYRRQLAAL